MPLNLSQSVSQVQRPMYRFFSPPALSSRGPPAPGRDRGKHSPPPVYSSTSLRRRLTASPPVDDAVARLRERMRSKNATDSCLALLESRAGAAHPNPNPNPSPSPSPSPSPNPNPSCSICIGSICIGSHNRVRPCSALDPPGTHPEPSAHSPNPNSYPSPSPNAITRRTRGDPRAATDLVPEREGRLHVDDECGP